jgi:hypothetical protein
MTTDPKSGTPRTDALVKEWEAHLETLQHGGEYLNPPPKITMPEHARTLERELSRCREELERLQGDSIELRRAVVQAKAERDDAESRLASRADPAPSAASGLADALGRCELHITYHGKQAFHHGKVLVPEALLANVIYFLRSHQAPVGEGQEARYKRLRDEIVSMIPVGQMGLRQRVKQALDSAVSYEREVNQAAIGSAPPAPEKP